MAPKRKAPSATQSQVIGKKNKPSPGKLRSVQDLFAALPASSNPSKKKAQDLIGSSSTAVPQDGCNDPWTEKYAPTSRSQLAVHKKKVEVRGRYRLLLPSCLLLGSMVLLDIFVEIWVRLGLNVECRNWIVGSRVH